MYFDGVSSLPLIGQSGPSRFWPRLLIDVSAMIDVAKAVRTSSHSLAVDFMERIPGRASGLPTPQITLGVARGVCKPDALRNANQLAACCTISLASLR